MNAISPASSGSSAAVRPSPALWQQLQLAAQGLRAVRAGQSARAVLQLWPASLRPGAQALLYHGLRHLGTAQVLREQLATRKPSAQVDALLCLALAALWQPDAVGYDDFTLVNQAVTALRKQRDTQAQAGFVNACLRRFLRERAALQAVVAQSPLAQWNHPLWWIEKLQRQYPAQWQAVLEANNGRAPLSLRINTTQISRGDYLAQLQEQGMAAWPVQGSGLLLTQAVDVRQLPGYAEGWFSVQDAGAQTAAPLLLEGLQAADPSAPLRILDACAAPGGKSAHLIEHARAIGQSIRLLALDVDAARCERIHENLQRLRLQAHAQVQVADAGQVAQWQAHLQGRLLDGILLDAPCTASGIVRRHPDVRWLRRPEDVAALAKTQQYLLRQLWPLLREGGRLLYCTCSVFHEEGQDQMQQFLAQHANARLVHPVQHGLPRYFSAVQAPAAGESGEDHDGFFYGLLEKTTGAGTAGDCPDA